MNPERFVRAYNVMNLLARHPGGLRLTDVSQALELPPSSTHDLLNTMVAAGLASNAADNRYLLGPRAIRLGIRIVGSLEVRGIARRHCGELVRVIGYDVYLAVRVGGRVVYVDRFPGTKPVSVDIPLGQSLYLHATAVGKLFAANDPDLHARVLDGPLRELTSHTITDAAALRDEFERILRQRYAISREEAVEGIEGLALPIRQASGQLVASLHVSMLRGGLGQGWKERLLPVVAEAAARIERDLGHTSSSPEADSTEAMRV